MNSNFPLGVCLIQNLRLNAARPSAYPQYLLEILDHAGIPYQPIAADQLADSLDSIRILITVGEAVPDENLRQKLSRWLKEGGAWLALAGTAGMPGELGVEHVAPPPFGSLAMTPFRLLGEGYLQPSSQSDHLTGPLPRPLHFFNGIVVKPAGASVLASCLDPHQRRTTHPAICQHSPGKGTAILLAPDLPGTIVHIQQGRAITRDGFAAPDGSAPISDGVLKSDDGQVLDWEFDRGPLPAAGSSDTETFYAFLDPIADYWRNILLRTLFHLAHKADIPLPMLWLYPGNAPATALLSHDSDLNIDATAERMLSVLDELKLHSTWCIILPGFNPAILAKARAAGHELATHFDAMEEGQVWSRANFRRQVAELTALFDTVPVSNKNHYLRWEGDDEFWHWCVEEGLQLDQSKGPSKIGGSGFNFGTCHPHFPLSRQGKPIDVLSLPTLTQDLPITAPIELADALLSGTLAVHGVMHVLFHQAHIDKPGVADAIRRIVRQSRSQGVQWRTASQINAWERARRSIRWISCDRIGDGLAIRLVSAVALKEATMLIPRFIRVATANGKLANTTTVERYGRKMTSVALDIHANQEIMLELK